MKPYDRLGYITTLLAAISLSISGLVDLLNGSRSLGLIQLCLAGVMLDVHRKKQI